MSRPYDYSMVMESALVNLTIWRTASRKHRSLVQYWEPAFKVQPCVEVSEYDQALRLKDAIS
jgi:hypothetical protein